jgi:hypothetical protein
LKIAEVAEVSCRCTAEITPCRSNLPLFSSIRLGAPATWQMQDTSWTAGAVLAAASHGILVPDIARMSGLSALSASRLDLDRHDFNECALGELPTGRHRPVQKSAWLAFAGSWPATVVPSPLPTVSRTVCFRVRVGLSA